MGKRGKRAVFEAGVIARAEKIISELSYGSPELMAVSVLLASKGRMTSEQIGAVLGVGHATVVRMNQKFREARDNSASGWGGRRNESMSKVNEAKFFEAMEERAKRGEVVGAKHIKAEIDARIGRKTSLQTAYNLLKRAKWRKVVPDKVHPKGDPMLQEDFKKRPFRRPSKWLPPSLQSQDGR